MSHKLYWVWEKREAILEEITRQVGPGWKNLVEHLVTDLFQLGWDGHLVQIKEKFGGLRFYINHGNDQVWERINEAEKLSCITCENCGAAGKQTHGGWIKTLCPNCTKVSYE